jgi:hypothetical protein
MTTAVTAAPLAKLADYLGLSLAAITATVGMTDAQAAQYLGISPAQLVAGRASNTNEFFTSMAPATGTSAGGTATVLTGKGFTGATAVQFGGTNGTAFSVVNDTTINVTSPAKGVGVYNVAVVRPNGNIVKPSAWTAT